MGQDTESEGGHGAGLFDSLSSLPEHRCFRLSCAEQAGCALMGGTPWPGFAAQREPFEEFPEISELPNGCALFQLRPCFPAQETAMGVQVSPILESDVTVAVTPEHITAHCPTSLSSGPRPNIRGRLQQASEDRERRKLARPDVHGPSRSKKKSQKRKATKKSKQKENMMPRRMLPRRECCPEGSIATREPKPEQEPKPDPEPELEPGSVPEPGREQQDKQAETKVFSPAMSNSSKSDVECSGESTAISETGLKPSGRMRLPESAVTVLTAWYAAHPKLSKPEAEEFEQLVKESGLKRAQVCM